MATYDSPSDHDFAAIEVYVLPPKANCLPASGTSVEQEGERGIEPGLAAASARAAAVARNA